jgi:hypothetical protein
MDLIVGLPLDPKEYELAGFFIGILVCAGWKYKSKIKDLILESILNRKNVK